MTDWFLSTFGDAVAEARHELLGGWFGRTFEAHPTAPRSALNPADIEPEPDLYGRDQGVDRAR